MGDPFRGAYVLAQMLSNASAQDNRSADNMLMRMFQEEVQRQRPYGQLPAYEEKQKIKSKYKTRRSSKGKKKKDKDKSLSGDVGDDGTYTLANGQKVNLNE